MNKICFVLVVIFTLEHNSFVYSAPTASTAGSGGSSGGINAPTFSYQGGLIQCARKCAITDKCERFLYGEVSTKDYDCGFGEKDATIGTPHGPTTVGKKILPFAMEQYDNTTNVAACSSYIQMNATTTTIGLPLHVDSCLLLVGAPSEDLQLKLNAFLSCKNCGSHDVLYIYNVKDDVNDDDKSSMNQSEGSVVCNYGNGDEMMIRNDVIYAANGSFFLIHLSVADKSETEFDISLEFTLEPRNTKGSDKCTECSEDLSQQHCKTEEFQKADSVFSPYIKFHNIDVTKVKEPATVSTNGTNTNIITHKDTNATISLPIANATISHGNNSINSNNDSSNNNDNSSTSNSSNSTISDNSTNNSSSSSSSSSNYNNNNTATSTHITNSTIDTYNTTTAETNPNQSNKDKDNNNDNNNNDDSNPKHSKRNSSASTASTTPTGAIVGGAVGGVAALGAGVAIAAVLYKRMKKNKINPKATTSTEMTVSRQRLTSGHSTQSGGSSSGVMRSSVPCTHTVEGVLVRQTAANPPTDTRMS